MIPGQNSSIYDATQPPGMAPESQSPPWWKVAQANTQQGMSDPKQQVMMAMLMRQLGQAGQGLAGGPPSPMRRVQPMVPGFDLYGNPFR